MKHRASSTRMMNAPEKHNGQTDVSLCPLVCPFVSWAEFHTNRSVVIHSRNRRLQLYNDVTGCCVGNVVVVVLELTKFFESVENGTRPSFPDSIRCRRRRCWRAVVHSRVCQQPSHTSQAITSDSFGQRTWQALGNHFSTGKSRSKIKFYHITYMIRWFSPHPLKSCWLLTQY